MIKVDVFSSGDHVQTNSVEPSKLGAETVSTSNDWRKLSICCERTSA